MVIPRAIIRDRYTGIEATRMMALVMLVLSVGPMLAPLIGSLLMIPFGWRAVFAAVAMVAVAALVLVWRTLPETHAPEARVPIRITAMLSGFGILLRDRQFMALTLIGGLGMSSFFAFLASSSFIYIDHFGLTPTEYSLAFSFNAVGFFAATQLAATLGARFGIPAVIRGALIGYATGAAVLTVTTLAGLDDLAALMAMLFITFAFLGLVIPTAMILALEEHGPIAGKASALGGTIQMVLGACAIAVSSALFDGTSRPMVLIIAGCAVGALLLSRVIRPARPEPAPAARGPAA